MKAAIDQIFRDAVARGDVPGVIAMATDGRDTLYEGAFGVRELGGERPMRTDTVCWIHSMTKAITGACIMQLVEQGRLGLDDDCGRLVPALARPRVLEGFDADGTPRFRPARGAITLRRLLTHTAGFVYDMWNADMLRYNRASGLSRTATFARPEDCQPLSFDPGERWHYGINIDHVGKIIEQASGVDLETYFQQHIFQPLGMTETSFLLPEEKFPRLAANYQRKDDGLLHQVPPALPPRPASYNGGGGLFSTAPDYIRFLQFFLRGGDPALLSPASFEAMVTSQTPNFPAGRMTSTNLERSCDVDFDPGRDDQFTLGFLINPKPFSWGRSANSLAWAGIRNTFYWIDPARGVAAVLLMQFQPFCDPAALRLLHVFEKELYASL